MEEVNNDNIDNNKNINSKKEIPNGTRQNGIVKHYMNPSKLIVMWLRICY